MCFHGSARNPQLPGDYSTVCEKFWFWVVLRQNLRDASPLQDQPGSVRPSARAALCGGCGAVRARIIHLNQNSTVVRTDLDSFPPPSSPLACAEPTPEVSCSFLGHAPCSEEVLQCVRMTSIRQFTSEFMRNGFAHPTRRARTLPAARQLWGLRSTFNGEQAVL